MLKRGKIPRVNNRKDGEIVMHVYFLTPEGDTDGSYSSSDLDLIGGGNEGTGGGEQTGGGPDDGDELG